MSRWKIVLRAWPPLGGAFILLSFLVTAFWLWHAATGIPDVSMDWLEPAAAFLAGSGAFVLTAILIFRRIDRARTETDSYSLARGLATGYYFNFIRPIVSTISDPEHPVHRALLDKSGHKIVGGIVGLPKSIEEFDPSVAPNLIRKISDKPSASFSIEDLQIEIPGRPRPLFTKVAYSKRTQAAVIIDVPTTLSVIADFANFFAEKELEGAPAADDSILSARAEIVTDSQTKQFHNVLNEFIEVVSKVGSKEDPGLSPAPIIHLVPMSRLEKRLAEIADH